MRNIAQFAGCVIRWGGVGGAMLGTLLYSLWLAIVVVSDIARTGSWPYYNLVYVVLGLLTGAIIGFILGIFMALINGAAIGLLVAAFRLRSKSANGPRKVIALTLTLVSGLGMFAYLASLTEVSTANTWPHTGWLRAGAAILASCWAWLVSEKAPRMSLQ